MRYLLVVFLLAIIFVLPFEAEACTGVFVKDANQCYFGNNEDYNDPDTYIWFESDQGSYDRIYLGYGNFFPQGGMNERGLCFDGFATLPNPVTPDPSLPELAGNYVDEMLRDFSTVEEVAEYFLSHSRTQMANYMLFFADSSGNSLIVEGDSLVWLNSDYQVCTNFYQTAPELGSWPCWRYDTACSMLEDNQLLHPEFVRDVMDACHIDNSYPTQYTNIFDLKNKTLRLYYFHEYTRFIYLTFEEAANQLQSAVRISDLIVLAGIEDIPELPLTSDVLTTYPNPFNSTLSINLENIQDRKYSLSIFDILGRQIHNFTEGSPVSNDFRFNWNAKMHGSGTYFVRLESEGHIVSKKVILLR